MFGFVYCLFTPSTSCNDHKLRTKFQPYLDRRNSTLLPFCAIKRSSSSVLSIWKLSHTCRLLWLSPGSKINTHQAPNAGRFLRRLSTTLAGKCLYHNNDVIEYLAWWLRWNYSCLCLFKTVGVLEMFWVEAAPPTDHFENSQFHVTVSHMEHQLLDIAPLLLNSHLLLLVTVNLLSFNTLWSHLKVLQWMCMWPIKGIQ